jgi:hypothetical protein
MKQTDWQGSLLIKAGRCHLHLARYETQVAAVKYNCAL